MAHEKQLKDTALLKEKKKNKNQIIEGNEFRISWNRREGRTMRRQESKASGGQVRTEQHRAEKKACRGKTGWLGEQKQYKNGDKLKKLYLQGCVGNKQNNNQ